MVYMDAKGYSRLYRDNLLNDVIPFWLKHSRDDIDGGFLTCLDRKGEVFDTDKFVWLQCREVWCFAMLYERVEKRQEWIDFAVQGADFLMRHGRDEKGHWYFSLTREGKPLVQPYNIFSDCFAVMAFGRLYKVTGREEYKKIALDTFHHILERYDQPKGRYSKSVPGARPLQGLSLPMILSGLVVEMEGIADPALIRRVIDDSIHAVFHKFYHAPSGLMLENVPPDGGFSDTFEGRLVMPGHSLESMWFMMDLAERLGDRALMEKATGISLDLLAFGWDRQYEGIYYMLDIKGHPTQQLEWDQKLWWVHFEAIVCMLKGYLHTGDPRCRDWFERLHTYTWDHFGDPEFGEWYGYLDRRGEVLLPLKGGKWKGCFHVPRCLYEAWKTLDRIAEKYPDGE